MDPRPFVQLPVARAVDRLNPAPDLARFYEENEGVGLESSPDRIVRLCLLEEVRRIGWRDLRISGVDECAGWEGFVAYRIGISCYFDEIVYVLDAPACPTGSILTIGVDVAGPGGSGAESLEPSLVLGATFVEWLARLESARWVEYGLVPGELAKLPDSEQMEMRRHYQALNPRITWGAA